MATGANKAEIVKFVQEEIKQTEEALAFVVSAIASGDIQHNRVYNRKKAEYEGVLWAYNAVLDIAGVRNEEETGAENGN